MTASECLSAVYHVDNNWEEAGHTLFIYMLLCFILVRLVDSCLTWNHAGHAASLFTQSADSSLYGRHVWGDGMTVGEVHTWSIHG
jgi:hypothetical protein